MTEWDTPKLLALPKGRVFYVNRNEEKVLLKRLKKLKRKGFFVQVKTKTRNYSLYQRTDKSL